MRSELRDSALRLEAFQKQISGDFAQRESRLASVGIALH